VGVSHRVPARGDRIKAGETSVASSSASGRSLQGHAKRAARALPAGRRLIAAIEIQRSLGTHAAPVTLTVPLEIKRSASTMNCWLWTAPISRSSREGEQPSIGAAVAERKSARSIRMRVALRCRHSRVPAADYRKIRAQAVSVVRRLLSDREERWLRQHRLRATGGELRSPEIGVCRSDADSSASYVRCRQIGRAPNCYASTLYGPGWPAQSGSPCLRIRLPAIHSGTYKHHKLRRSGDADSDSSEWPLSMWMARRYRIPTS